MARGGFELIQEVVAAGRIDLSRKARGVADAEGWWLDDIAACVATGVLTKRERDEMPTPQSDRWKYTIESRGRRGGAFYVAGKLARYDDGQWWFWVITAHRPERR